MRVVERKCLVYSNRDENSNKFYIVEVQEENEKFNLSIRYGRLGKNPTIKDKPIISQNRAISELMDTVYKKKKKGYVEVDIEDIIDNGADWWN